MSLIFFVNAMLTIGYILSGGDGAMWDLLGQVAGWLLLIFFVGQAVIFIGLVGWAIWTDAIRPD